MQRVSVRTLALMVLLLFSVVALQYINWKSAASADDPSFIAGSRQVPQTCVRGPVQVGVVQSCAESD